MLRQPKFLAPLLFVATVVPIAIAPIAGAAEPGPVAGDESASATISDLRAQGYNVMINGDHPVPLSRCAVTGIENPGSTADRRTSTTVYVDVDCPNDI